MKRRRRRHDVADGVESSDLVEMHVFGRKAVHLGLGLGQQLEHREGMIGHGHRKLASPDQPADLAETAVLVMVFIAVNVMMLVSLAVVVMMPVSLAVVVMMLVSMVVVVMMLVSMAVVVMMLVSMVVVVMMLVSMVVVVTMIFRVVHRAAAGGIEHIELGPGDAPAGHLSRSELHPLHPESGHVALDLVQARSKVDEGAHEHIAAHPCRGVEVEDAPHLELSFRPPAASLLIMSAW